MFSKQIYDLKSGDLIKHPAWYFPMDDSVEDELSIRPCSSDELSADFQVIVKTAFTDCEGKQYVGYIYWNDPAVIEDLKPVFFVDEDRCITLWNGMIKPSWKDYDDDIQVMSSRFPITYRSDDFASLRSISGVLEGLYFLDDDDNIRYL